MTAVHAVPYDAKTRERLVARANKQRIERLIASGEMNVAGVERIDAATRRTFISDSARRST